MISTHHGQCTKNPKKCAISNVDTYLFFISFSSLKKLFGIRQSLCKMGKKSKKQRCCFKNFLDVWNLSSFGAEICCKSFLNRRFKKRHERIYFTDSLQFRYVSCSNIQKIWNQTIIKRGRMIYLIKRKYTMTLKNYHN